MKRILPILLVLLMLGLFFISCKKLTGASYEIDETSCVACGQCYDVCPHNAIDYDGDKPVIISSKCVSCGKCADVCPENAIH